MPDREKPARIKPPMGPDNGWWWEQVAAGRIPIQRCAECGKLRHPPRPMCDACQSLEWGSVEATGRGTLRAYTVIHYPEFPGYSYPIVAGLVDLEEGERMLSHVVGCAPEDVHVGMALEGFVHEDEDGFKLPMFRPAD